MTSPNGFLTCGAGGATTLSRGALRFSVEHNTDDWGTRAVEWTLGFEVGTSPTGPFDYAFPADFSTGCPGTINLNPSSPGSVTSTTFATFGMTPNVDLYFQVTLTDENLNEVDRIVCGPYQAEGNPTGAVCLTQQIEETTARLQYGISNGQIDTVSCSQDTVVWEYGTTSGGPYDTVLPSEDASNPLRKDITGLTPNTTYFYRATVSNQNGDVILTAPQCQFTTDGAPPPAEFSCNELSGSRSRHRALLVINSTLNEENANDGDDFRFEQSTAGPNGPWTLSTLSGTSPTNPDCDAVEPNPFTTGGSRSGLAVVVSPRDLERDTDYWYRTTHEFSQSGGPTGEQLVCGPYRTTGSDDLVCATPSNITQNSVDLAQPAASSENPYIAGACDLDSFRLEYGTAPGVYTQTSSLPPASDTTGPTHSLTGLTPETTYYFRTTLVDAVDGDIEVSPECSFTTLADDLGPTITGLDDQSGPVNVRQSDTFQVQDEDGTVVSVTSAPPGATLVDEGNGTWTIGYTPTAVGATTFTITVTDDDGLTATDTITFTGTAATVTQPFQPQPCAADPVDPGTSDALTRDVEGTLLCDVVDGEVVGSALVESVYDEEGNRVGTRTVNPATGEAYVPQGVLQPCATGAGGGGEAGVDVETAVLCDRRPDGTTVTFAAIGVYNRETGAFISERYVGSNGAAYVPQGDVGTCLPPTVGWEPICYTTTAGGDEVLTGTKRHDDRFPAPGFQVFDSSGARVDNAPGYEQVVCATCCDQQVGEGCWDSNGTTRQWISMRSSDGTIRVTDTRTGALVPEASIVACDEQTTNRTTFVSLDGVQTHTINGDELISWSIRVIDGGANIDINGANANFLPGAVIESGAESGSTLTDAVTVVAQGGASRIFVTYVNRV